MSDNKKDLAAGQTEQSENLSPEGERRKAERRKRSLGAQKAVDHAVQVRDDQIADLRRQLKEAQNDSDRHAAEYKRVEAICLRLDAGLHEASTRLAEALADLDREKTAAAGMKAGFDRCLAEREAAQVRQLGEQKEALAAEEARREAIQRVFEEAKAQIDKKEREIETFKGHQKKTADDFHRLYEYDRKKTASTAEQIAKIEEGRRRLEEQLALKESDLNQKSEELATAQAELTDAVRELTQQESAIRRVMTVLDGRNVDAQFPEEEETAERTPEKLDLEEFEQSAHAMDLRLVGATERYQRAEAVVQQLREEIVRLKIERDDQLTQLGLVHQEKIAELNRQLAEAAGKLGALENEKTVELGTLQYQLDTSRSERQRLQGELDDLRSRGLFRVITDHLFRSRHVAEGDTEDTMSSRNRKKKMHQAVAGVLASQRVAAVGRTELKAVAVGNGEAAALMGGDPDASVRRKSVNVPEASIAFVGSESPSDADAAAAFMTFVAMALAALFIGTGYYAYATKTKRDSLERTVASLKVEVNNLKQTQHIDINTLVDITKLPPADMPVKVAANTATVPNAITASVNTPAKSDTSQLFTSVPTEAPNVIPNPVPTTAKPPAKFAVVKAPPTAPATVSTTAKRHRLQPARGYSKVLAGRSECERINLGPERCESVGTGVDKYVSEVLNDPLLQELKRPDGTPFYVAMHKRGRGGHYTMGDGVGRNTWMHRRTLRAALRLPEVRKALGGTAPRLPGVNRWDENSALVWAVFKGEFRKNPELLETIASIMAKEKIPATKMAAVK